METVFSKVFLAPGFLRTKVIFYFPSKYKFQIKNKFYRTNIRLLTIVITNQIHTVFLFRCLREPFFPGGVLTLDFLRIKVIFLFLFK